MRGASGHNASSDLATEKGSSPVRHGGNDFFSDSDINDQLAGLEYFGLYQTDEEKIFFPLTREITYLKKELNGGAKAAKSTEEPR